ncbi:hypothetical protein OG948_38370 (plasmid) [Embleya sp. NBC_00888]|uniref:hypothetical protein n=1 Tax=Embleya sp. NBC_00888 TaxID=2975960 RepID=UPI002F90FEDA|nr:hypothetical protein OG948_38370 [Embleya sp. NBC_00888]
MTSLRSTLGAALATAAVIVGLAVGPAQAAPDGAQDRVRASASATHTYNPNAPLGSPDNPEILDGQDKAVLDPQQLKALQDSKRARVAQAKSGTVQLAGPCIIGAYWSSCNSIKNFGQLNIATELGSGHHEYIRQQGWLYGSGYWQTYMDRSTNGGASWDPVKYSVVLNSSGWGGEQYDGPGVLFRGCLWNMSTNYVACTGWH